MKFRDDIDPANTWIVSDTHFGHENIVGYCARPLDHDQLMVAEWRAHVPNDATVLHLGDLCWKSNGYFKHVIAPELTGQRKLLIMGNHDKGRPSWYKDCGFQVVRPFAIGLNEAHGELWDNGAHTDQEGQCEVVVEFDHYPSSGRFIEPWKWRLHGHIHNNGYYDGRSNAGGPDWSFVPFLRNHINLSVEQTRYRPVNLKLLLDGAILGRLP